PQMKLLVAHAPATRHRRVYQDFRRDVIPRSEDRENGELMDLKAADHFEESRYRGLPIPGDQPGNAGALRGVVGPRFPRDVVREIFEYRGNVPSPEGLVDLRDNSQIR